jgi:hypothetical protein
MLNDMVAAFTASSKIGEAMQEKNKSESKPTPPRPIKGSSIVDEIIDDLETGEEEAE